MPPAPPDRVLRVDLSAGSTRSEAVPEAWLDAYIGGKGLGARYLYEELAPGVDPLGPENRLVFALGPLTGLTPGEQRYAAITKSPLTGGFLDSYAGGRFPGSLAGALDGGVALILAGRAPEPVVVEVEGGDASLRSAADLAGATADEVGEASPDAAVACVGPAGENRVRFATIASDGGDHQAGRGGAGAVMGAKNVKAVLARGDPPEGLDGLRQADTAAFADDGVGRWQAAGGTVETVDFADAVGALPTRGWQGGAFEGAADIGIEAIQSRARGRESDEPIPGDFRVGDDPVPRGGAFTTLGAGLGIDDFDAVVDLGGACDRLGLDVITAGSAVAFAVRASDAGHIGRDLSFGDAGAARDLVREIARRSTPLGDALADGVAAAAEALGGADLVPTVKAMELPAYDPRAAPSMALAYATSDRGACHRRARPVEREAIAGEWTPAERVEAVIEEQDARSVLWSLIVDDFVGEAVDGFAPRWLAAVGRPAGSEELRRTGERIWTLTRLFNVREGFDRDDDALPAVLTEPLPDGPAAGEAIDPEAFERLLDRYYAARGWGADGRPTGETVERLGLDGVVDEHTPLADDATQP